MTNLSRPTHRFDGPLLAVVAFGLFVVCRPDALHDQSLALLGMPGLPTDLASTPLAAVWLTCVNAASTVCGSIHAAALMVAALAVAVSAWMTHLAARILGLSRVEALVSVALVAFTPAAAMAATTVHVHAFELCEASVAVFLASRMARGGHWVVAGLLGIVVGGALIASPTGMLLAIAIVPFLFGEVCDDRAMTASSTTGSRHRGWRSPLLLALLSAVVAVMLVFACQWQHGPALIPSWDQIANYDLLTMWQLLIRDAGRSFLPLSFGVLVALWSVQWHRRALGLLLVVAVGLVLGCHLTMTLGDDGSFLLPVLPMAALLVARALSRRWSFVFVTIAVLLSGTKILLHTEHGAAAAFAKGYHQLSAERSARVLAGPYADQAFLLSRLPDVQQQSVLGLAGVDTASTPQEVVAELTAAVAAGAAIWLTEEAEQALRDPEFRARYPHSAALLESLESSFTWHRQRAAGFVATELVPR